MGGVAPAAHLPHVTNACVKVAEGVATTPAAVRLAAKHGVDVPMMQAVDDILAGRLDPASAMRQMMALPVQDE